jgi:hypothetical protein
MRYLRWLLPFAAAAVLVLSTSCSSGSSAALRVYGLGDKAEIGRLVYTVHDTQWLPQIGEGLSARIPQHRFFEIRLSAVNSSATEVIVPNSSLEDDNGNTYQELSNGDGVPSWIGFVRRAESAETLTGIIVFDAPPQHYRLRLTGENSERAAFVDIPLSFSGSSPAFTPSAPSDSGARQ